MCDNQGAWLLGGTSHPPKDCIKYNDISVAVALSNNLAFKGSLTTVHWLRRKFDEGLNDVWPDRVSAEERSKVLRFFSCHVCMNYIHMISSSTGLDAAV